MSDVVIKVDNLGKKYRIRHEQREPYTALRDVLTNKIAGFGSSVMGKGRHLLGLNGPANSHPADPLTSDVRPLTSDLRLPSSEDFWALKDVSFEIKRGDVIGIIGRNGAGKSTLLKLLSRITEPTEGCIKIKGRVASLLEVGTGFHPELTGRENIYLNGAILGMKKAEIKGKFDEIVAFAEVEKFIGTPVKHYSSGMYVRLAFAVAAHLEPEVLLVDEVLAVGDTAFQKKCLGKMEDVARSGRTILFVSHNIGAIRALCKNTVWLDEGRVRDLGPSATISVEYIKLVAGAATINISRSQHLQGNGNVRIESVILTDSDGRLKNSFLIGEAFDVNLYYGVHKPINGTFWLLVATLEGIIVLSSFQKDHSAPVELETDGVISSPIGSVAFLPGEYVVSAGLFDSAMGIVDWVDNVAVFEVLPQFADGRPFDHRYGIITQELQWKIRH